MAPVASGEGEPCSTKERINGIMNRCDPIALPSPQFNAAGRSCCDRPSNSGARCPARSILTPVTSTVYYPRLRRNRSRPQSSAIARLSKRKALGSGTAGMIAGLVNWGLTPGVCKGSAGQGPRRFGRSELPALPRTCPPIPPRSTRRFAHTPSRPLRSCRAPPPGKRKTSKISDKSRLR